MKIKPIYFEDQFYESIQKEIEWYIYDLIYKPLIDFLKEQYQIEIKNAKISRNLNDSLRAGKIVYKDGYFYGKFNSISSSELRKLGAKYNRRLVAFKLPMDKIPFDLRQSIAFGTAKLKSDVVKINQIMSDIQDNVNNLTYTISFTDNLDVLIKDLDKKLIKTVGANITISPTLSEGTKNVLYEKFNNNMDLSIKKWKEDAIVRLREKVNKNVFEGFRADKLEKILINEYHVTAKKAKFLAAQETSLLTSKYKEERYKDAGIFKYIWRTSKDGRVRGDHKELEGKTFTWSNPPITNRSTGARNNPGEDYGCRCVAEPEV